MDINFNDLLNNYLNDVESIEERCLISGEKLEINNVCLPCNHKFNYEYLYNEVVNQKSNKNHNEITHLLKNEIKCPYCRKIHKKLLPYNKDFVYVKNVMNKEEKVNKCVAIIKSGPNKGKVCNRKCNEYVCYFHRNYIVL